MPSRACATCGKSFRFVAGGKGQPPKHCPAHRKGGQRAKDTKGQKARQADRQREKRAAKRSAGNAREEYDASALAAGLHVHEDPEAAARWAGVELSDRLLDLARTRHGAVISGDPSGTGRELTAGIHLIVNDLIRERGNIAPRDKAHVAKALAQTKEVLGGKAKHHGFTDMKIFVLGVGGTPFDPNSIPQPPQDDEEEEE
jgi:hypothetical protein